MRATILFSSGVRGSAFDMNVMGSGNHNKVLGDYACCMIKRNASKGDNEKITLLQLPDPRAPRRTRIPDRGASPERRHPPAAECGERVDDPGGIAWGSFSHHGLTGMEQKSRQETSWRLHFRMFCPGFSAFNPVSVGSGAAGTDVILIRDSIIRQTGDECLEVIE
jgi:hypothetical protein